MYARLMELLNEANAEVTALADADPDGVNNTVRTRIRQALNILDRKVATLPQTEVTPEEQPEEDGADDTDPGTSE